MKCCSIVLFCFASLCLFASDEEGRISLFVVGCFTPEFQDIFDGDLDGYLLIGDNGDIDGSYLPRNYDNEIHGQDCDLPIRRNKADTFNIIQGTFFECQALVDNTSEAGGGPFDAPSTMITIDFPDGIIPVSSSRDVTVSGNRVTCSLGTLNARAKKGVSIRCLATMTGSFEIKATVSSAIFDPDPSNNTPSYSFDVVAPGTHLIYPWISKNAQFASDIVINNYGSLDALVLLSAVRAEGEFHTRAMMVPARGFVRETTENLFPEIGEGAGYSMRLMSESQSIQGRWVTNNLTAASGSSPSQGVAINMLDELQAKDGAGMEILYGYLPISETLVSAPVIVNMGSSATDVQMDFYDRSGQLVFSDNQTLAAQQPYRPFATVANNLVPSESGDLYMLASSDSETLTGVGFVFNTSAEPAIGNVSNINFSQSSGTRLVLPWISNNAQFESIIVVNNLGNSEANVQLTAQRRTGDGESINRQIPANGFLAEFASNLFASLGDGSGYSVQVNANSPNIAGGWVTNNLTTASGSSPSQGVGIRLDDPNTTRYGQHLLFGFLPLTNGLTSAPVVVNVGDSAANITLRFYDVDGALIQEDTTSLAGLTPHRPFATVANTLVPAGSGDVYMVASSDGEPITGVAFVFNDGAEPAIGNVTAIDFQP